MLKPTVEFWQGKRVFLTGHSGFKGAWLTVWLQSLGAKVCGYSLPPETSPNLFSILNVGAYCEENIFADIRHYDTLKNALNVFAPDIVIHMAAQALVRESYHTPLATLATNIDGTANLLEACRTAPSVRSIVVVTTDKCYKNKEINTPYSEENELGGHDIYSASKACAEIVTHAYRQSFFEQGARIATARAGNVIGGGDWSKDRLIADAVRAFSAGETLQIRSPNAVRPWQHVVEPLLGYLMLARGLYENKPLSPAYNFGPNSASTATVSEVMTQFSTYWNPSAKWQVQPSEALLHEATLLALDASLAAKELGWAPALSLEESLCATASGYKIIYENGGKEAFLAHMNQLFSQAVL